MWWPGPTYLSIIIRIIVSPLSPMLHAASRPPTSNTSVIVLATAQGGAVTCMSPQGSIIFCSE
jgi:hypothetical protein